MAVPRSSESEENQRRGPSLLGRPPFQPNYATNVVFVLSIFQNAVSFVITHAGRPFCLVSLARLFAITLVSENFPWMNKLLELRPLPSRRFRRVLLSIFAVDFLGCFASKWLIEGLNGKGKVVGDAKIAVQSSAADVEETLLAEESKENQALLLIMFVLMLSAMTDAF